MALTAPVSPAQRRGGKTPLGLTGRAALVTVAPDFGYGRGTDGMTARVLCSLWLAAAAAAALAGCSAGYIFETYSGPIAPTLVTVGCHTTYEVYENGKERLIMVRTNVGAEIAGVACRDPGVRPTPRRAVEYHFETTLRPKCAIVEERKLTPIHWEFVYTCRP